MNEKAKDITLAHILRGLMYYFEEYVYKLLYKESKAKFYTPPPQKKNPQIGT